MASTLKTLRGIHTLWSALAVLLVSAPATQAATYFPIESVRGPTCIVRDSVTGIALPLSPEISKYNVVVTDGFAYIKMTQMYVNRIPNVNDIVYVFPLPHEGSVHAMAMEYNDMIYRAEILEREQAKAIYDSVKATGAVAALLLQDKPNIFQQRLANIAFMDTAFVEIELSMPLKYVDGEFELAIPTMVSPSFGGEQGMPQIGVNPWNPPEDINGQRLFVNTVIQTGFPVEGVTSPTHPVIVNTVEEERTYLEQQSILEEDSKLPMNYNTSVRLSGNVTYPNRDYVLRFRRDNAAVDFSMASYYSKTLGEGAFALQLYPNEDDFTATRPNLELIFLVDISGSQDGWPLEKEKAIVSEILSRLVPTDRFALCSFSSSYNWAFNGKIVSANSDNIATARAYVNGLSAGGGTNLLGAVNEVLAIEKGSEHERYFVFLTDGKISNEEAIFNAIENDNSNPTIFTFGAGNSLNRYFLDRAAEVGNGISTIITQDESVSVQVNEAWNTLEAPQLRNVTFDFGGLQVFDAVLPQSDRLYRGRPIEVYGRYQTGGTMTVKVKGYVDGSPVEFSQNVSVATGANMNTSVPKIWAKQMIDRLAIEEGATTSNKARIIDISTTYQVLSKYTAFLAVDGQQVEEGESLADQFVGTIEVADATRVMQQLVVRCDGRFLSLVLPAGAMLEEFAVYDLSGKLIFKKSLGQLVATGLFHWDGTLDTGKRLTPGRYVLRLKLAGKMISKTFVWR